VIASTSTFNSSSFSLQWNAIPGRTYRVHFTDNVTATNWPYLLPDISAITNIASKADSLTSTQRFYRISLLP
jgi:hypothetical protein